MLSLLKNIYYYFYNNKTYTHTPTNIIDNGEYERDLTIRTVRYDIETWHNKQIKEYNPECIIKSDIYNNTKPVWLILYNIYSLNNSKIYIYNVPVEKKIEMLYNTINEKIRDHLLHGDGGNYVYATYICVMCNSKCSIWNTHTKTVGNNQNDAGVILNCASHILVSDTIPDLSFLDSVRIELWITTCDYIIRPNIKGNNIYLDIYSYDITIPNYIDLIKSNIHMLDINMGNYVILPPFNTYIKDNFTLPKIRL